MLLYFGDVHQVLSNLLTTIRDYDLNYMIWSKFEKLRRIVKTTDNWFDIFLLYLGIKRKVVAKLKDGSLLTISK